MEATYKKKDLTEVKCEPKLLLLKSFKMFEAVACSMTLFWLAKQRRTVAYVWGTCTYNYSMHVCDYVVSCWVFCPLDVTNLFYKMTWYTVFLNGCSNTKCWGSFRPVWPQ